MPTTPSPLIVIASFLGFGAWLQHSRESAVEKPSGPGKTGSADAERRGGSHSIGDITGDKVDDVSRHGGASNGGRATRSQPSAAAPAPAKSPPSARIPPERSHATPSLSTFAPSTLLPNANADATLDDGVVAVLLVNAVFLVAISVCCFRRRYSKSMAPVAHNIPIAADLMNFPRTEHQDGRQNYPRSGSDFTGWTVALELDEMLEKWPYLRSEKFHLGEHPASFWVRRCREELDAKRSSSAKECICRIATIVQADSEQVSSAFRRSKQVSSAFRPFDNYGSGYLEAREIEYACAYIGWGKEEAKLMEGDHDGVVSLQDFEGFVGRMGGPQRLFERQRHRIAAGRHKAEDKLCVGARVRAYSHQGEHMEEAVVLDLQMDCKEAPGDGVLLGFGFGDGSNEGAHHRSDIVPPSWVEDVASSATALREIGILSEQQAFWSLSFPEGELMAVEGLVDCQRRALAAVRAQAAQNHDLAMPILRQRFADLQLGEESLKAVLDWVQHLAPIVIHVDIDAMGPFFELDACYHNQFETHTSSGAIDSEDAIRTRRESDLFGSAYDGVKPCDRPKYGALDVSNDYRGVVPAYQYGDSYLVLKDVRLRTTFASTDSRGIIVNRLGVPEKYAHVLAEYSDDELRHLVAIALASAEPQSKPENLPRLLRGTTSDPCKDWITVGYPHGAQRHGRNFFEVELQAGCIAPQIGLLSARFEERPGVASASGVGDDEEGWAIDGLRFARLHSGSIGDWNSSWPGSGSEVNQNVIIGVAVDLRERKIWFARDGEWDDLPAFSSTDIPAGIALYPALSVKGRAAFRFGQATKFPGPDASFAYWPGIDAGDSPIHQPRIGDSARLQIYKEAQIHGLVSLKDNVQRLVANPRYRDTPKSQRSWAVQVFDSGSCDGIYERVRVRNGMPLYKNKNGAIIFWHADEKVFCMNDREDFTRYRFDAALDPNDASCEPPRRGWRWHDFDDGNVPYEVFCTALAQVLDPSAVQRLASALLGADGNILREKDDTSFEAEWQRSGSKEPVESAWARVMTELKTHLLSEAGFAGAAVVETQHPYAALRDSWKQEVRIDNTSALVVRFARKSKTYDRCSKLSIMTGQPDAIVEHAADEWADCIIPGDTAEFVWETDGDGVSKPERRWGFFALVLPSCVSSPSQQQVDDFAERWGVALSRAAHRKRPTLERHCWDEARLRALCAKYDWDFEWMTEEGERCRRACG